MLYVPQTSLVPIWNNFSLSASLGVSVTPGTSGSEGTYTEIVDGALVTEDIYLVKLWKTNGFVAAAAKPHLLDIGVDEAAGTSYTTILNNLSCGHCPDAPAIGHQYDLPLFIKAGSSIAVRVQGQHATGTATRVALNLLGGPDMPHNIRAAAFAETIGAIASSQGTAFTPGTSSVEGAWTLVGTTVADLWGFVMSVDISDSTMNALAYEFDLAYGDASNKVLLAENWFLSTGSSESISSFAPPIGYADVPGGTGIYIRGACSGTPDAGWSCTVIGFGGVGHP